MKYRQPAMLALAAAFATALFTTAPTLRVARAQDQAQVQNQGQAENQAENQNQNQTRNALPDNVPELVTDYLNQDIFLSPGEGLKKVKLGMPLAQVREAWGDPDSRSGNALTDTKWTYRVGNSTRITLVGGATVKVMRVQGQVGSPYVTTEGASFGMPQYQIATIYGAGRATGDELRYPRRGVGFGFNRGQVNEIRVFAPE